MSMVVMLVLVPLPYTPTVAKMKHSRTIWAIPRYVHRQVSNLPVTQNIRELVGALGDMLSYLSLHSTHQIQYYNMRA